MTNILHCTTWAAVRYTAYIMCICIIRYVVLLIRDEDIILYLAFTIYLVIAYYLLQPLARGRGAAVYYVYCMCVLYYIYVRTRIMKTKNLLNYAHLHRRHVLISGLNDIVIWWWASTVAVELFCHIWGEWWSLIFFNTHYLIIYNIICVCMIN